ncbi:MAG: hypothetical protein J3K34DRAFT_247261 [Monoraphidium minutum]|nr:MAG: hypothetical protein J3K34DRAFT_247261 [Monoraphidium minutum]
MSCCKVEQLIGHFLQTDRLLTAPPTAAGALPCAGCLAAGAFHAPAAFLRKLGKKRGACAEERGEGKGARGALRAAGARRGQIEPRGGAAPREGGELVGALGPEWGGRGLAGVLARSAGGQSEVGMRAPLGRGGGGLGAAVLGRSIHICVRAAGVAGGACTRSRGLGGGDVCSTLGCDATRGARGGRVDECNWGLISDYGLTRFDHACQLLDHGQIKASSRLDQGRIWETGRPRLDQGPGWERGAAPVSRSLEDAAATPQGARRCMGGVRYLFWGEGGTRGGAFEQSANDVGSNALLTAARASWRLAQQGPTRRARAARKGVGRCCSRPRAGRAPRRGWTRRPVGSESAAGAPGRRGAPRRAARIGGGLARGWKGAPGGCCS